MYIYYTTTYNIFLELLNKFSDFQFTCIVYRNSVTFLDDNDFRKESFFKTKINLKKLKNG